MREKRPVATTRELAASRSPSLIGGHGSRFYQQPTQAVTSAEEGVMGPSDSVFPFFRDLKAVILSAGFRPPKWDESNRRICAFHAALTCSVGANPARKCIVGSGRVLARYRPAIHGSFVGSPSPCEELRCLRMTGLRVETDRAPGNAP
jgi:hypothetical protein